MGWWIFVAIVILILFVLDIASFMNRHYSHFKRGTSNEGKVIDLTPRWYVDSPSMAVYWLKKNIFKWGERSIVKNFNLHGTSPYKIKKDLVRVTYSVYWPTMNDQGLFDLGTYWKSSYKKWDSRIVINRKEGRVTLVLTSKE